MRVQLRSGQAGHSDSSRAPVAGKWFSWVSTVLVMVALTGIADGITALPTQAAVTDPPTVVSLTFDDGNADQMSSVSTLNQLGLKGTFFITTGWIDQPGWLTRGQLATIAAAGHEIGGHTVTHPDLTTVTADEATRQICNGRATLAGWGFPTTSFAYPFAAVNPAVEAAVQACGFNSARNLGDIDTRFGCTGCGFAETIPAADPFQTRAADEVDSTWTLADLEKTVTNAETSGGGWVQFTFHHICVSGCDPTLTTTPAIFQQFAAWLAPRAASNNTTVKTVGQVIGGTVKPVVSGPAVTPKPVGSNLITNPGLETLTSGVPQCWQNGFYGTNAPTFRTVSPGHTGTTAAQLTMTGYVSGDAKWLPALDLGGCSGTATPGHIYALGAWYKSTVPTQFEVYYRTGLGLWTYWTASPFFPGATTYQKATWTTPALPAGASGVSFGLNLVSNGTLTTDDYEMFDSATVVAPPPPPAGANLVQNASLETAGTGSTPQCWQSAGYGTNTSAFSTVATAHTGTKAERLVVSGYASGDAKLVQTLDSGGCAPPAIAAHTYSLRTWYTSTAVTQFAVYYRNAAGTWVYWTSSPWFAATTAYTQVSLTTPALPAGATAISFGLNLFNNGTLVTDDYAMYDTVGAPAL